MIRKMHPAEEICYVMKRAYERNMVSSAGGCLSIRDEDGHMWISPTSQDKGNLKPEIIAEYDAEGNQLSAYAGSMEWDNHLAVYRARSDVKAIFHTHSSGVLSTAFARKALTVQFADAARILGPIAEVPFSVPASQQLLDDVVAMARTGSNVLTLDSHGTYILSDTSLFDAFKLQDLLEMTARCEAVAPAIGASFKPLTPAEVERYAGVTEIKETYGPETETVTAAKAREQLCELARRAYDNRVLDLTLGSFSVRLGEDDFLITPANRDIANLLPEEIVRVKGGKAEEGKALPLHTALHREIYNRKAYAGSVMTGTPAYAAAYCVAEGNFDCSIDPELTFCVKGVKKYSADASDAQIAEGFEEDSLAAVVEHRLVAAAAVNGVKTLGIFECLEYATRAVAEMAIRNLKPVRIAEYVK